MTSSRIIITLCLITLIFAGCNRRQTGLPQGIISEYLPFTLNDNFRLVLGLLEHVERTSFDRSELLIIYEVLSNLESHEGVLPWEENPEYWITGINRPILYITNEAYEVRIWFRPPRPSPTVFVAVETIGAELVPWFITDDYVIYVEPVQWFTADRYAYDIIRGLLPPLR